MNTIVALVPAAGRGTRFGGKHPKQYLALNDQPLMWHTLATLAQVDAISRIALILSTEDAWFDQYHWPWPKLSIYRVGGKERAHTVKQGLLALHLAPNDWVMVHDAVRCCVTTTLIKKLITALSDDPVGGLAALPVSDTLKHANADHRIESTLARQSLWLAQTPQMFRAGLLLRALEQQPLDNITDEASSIEALGLNPRLIRGEQTNFKVTWPNDLALARLILNTSKG